MDIADRLRVDVPMGQAGMGGGLAGAPLAGAVAKAGGLGTLGLASPSQLRTSIDQVHAEAPGRAVAVNLFMQGPDWDLTVAARRQRVGDHIVGGHDPSMRLESDRRGLGAILAAYLDAIDAGASRGAT